MDNPHCVSEEAAKWRRCPMAMGQKVDLEHSFCLGSDCMAWRWAYVHWYETSTRRPDHSKTHGYCGMVKND